MKNDDLKWEKVIVNVWKPKIGDKIEGKLVKIDENNKQKIYVLETADKKRTRIWGKTYLDQLMDEVSLNDYIRITYNGFEKTKNDREMMKFNVERRINYE